MSTYAIGDIQGCFDPLQKLLDLIQFDPANDTLWYTGDLVNRGPKSLETLRFIKNLGSKHRTVLGNHDLHLLALSFGVHEGWKEDTLKEILSAPDRDELMSWLRHQPLLIHEKDYVMVHAGLAANWDLATAKKLAHEVESVIQSDDAKNFFQHMYGDMPNQWNDNLRGYDRLRCITNFLTRSRFCYPDGSMELEKKGPLNSSELLPLFRVPHRMNADLQIIFGHWAALGGVTNMPGVFALDTGCVWGFGLTAMRLEDQKRYRTECNHS
jgi:bis(5'-nucleosyl)-tetraphosphatase (symmetrical)